MELPHRAIAVYCYLSERANRDGECWPAVPTIAQEIKLSEKTVRRAIRDLKKERVIETKQRYRTKGGKSSLLFKIL
jgi:DNA-binding FadR family transcriptional regulator